MATKIGGQLDLSEAELSNPDHTALPARDALVGNALVIRDATIIGGVDLYRASVTISAMALLASADDEASSRWS